jgi:hypothetical protein
MNDKETVNVIGHVCLEMSAQLNLKSLVPKRYKRQIQNFWVN